MKPALFSIIFNSPLQILPSYAILITTTKYVYGLGFIGEEKNSSFKTYHFDYRGSTVAITEGTTITDTFEYDMYGKLKTRTGTSDVMFLYNGRDGVVTDDNGLYYMRARYYSPEMKRFVNADIVAGTISDAVTLNRYAYANGNPVAFVDPFGLAAERGMTEVYFNHNYAYHNTPFYNLPIDDKISIMESVADIKSIYDEYSLYRKHGYNIYRKGSRAYVIGGAKVGKAHIYRKSYYDIPKISKASNVDDYWDILKNVDVPIGLKSELSLLKPSGKGFNRLNKGAVLNYIGVALDVGIGIAENIEAGTDTQRIITDAAVDAGVGVGIIAGSTAIGSAVGSVVPVAGNIIGAGVGFVAGVAIDWAVNTDIVGDKSLVDLAKDGVDAIADGAVELVEDAGDFFEDAGDAIGGFFSSIFG